MPKIGVEAAPRASAGASCAILIALFTDFGLHGPYVGHAGSISAVIAGDDERSAAALPLRSQHGFGDRVRSSQSYGTGT